jgi:hypothetical protein
VVLHTPCRYVPGHNLDDAMVDSFEIISNSLSIIQEINATRIYSTYCEGIQVILP